MGNPKAKKEFEFPIWRYDETELDRNKTKWFQKGDELPLELILILQRGNPEFLDFEDNKSKVSDISKPMILTSKGPVEKQKEPEPEKKVFKNQKKEKNK